MNIQDFTGALTDRFEEHQTKLVSQVICVDYIPLTVWVNNVEYYCTIESSNGSTFSINFKDHLSSDHCVTGIFRERNLKIRDIIYNLNTVQNDIANAFSGDDITAMYDKVNTSLLQELTNSLENIDALKVVREILNQNIDALTSINSMEPSKVNAILSTIITALEDSLKVPDTIEGLWQFLSKYEVVSLSNISEVGAKNIITSHIVKSDAYMLLANFELLHLFFGRFCRARRFSSATQRTFQALPEFVPILMKFGGVPNPLLDVSNESCLFETIKPLFRFLRNTEMCTNICTFTGAPFDSVYTVFDYAKPETYEVSRIVYGLASDFNQIFNGSSIAILPQPDALIKTDNILYATDLAVSMFTAVTTMAAVLGILTQDAFKLKEPVMTMSLKSDNNKVYIDSCTTLAELRRDANVDRKLTDYTDITLLRAVAASMSTKTDLSEAVRKERMLRTALDNQQKNMLQFRDLGVNLDD